MTCKAFKKISLVLILAIVVLITVIFGSTVQLFASADEETAKIENVIADREEVEPLAILVKMNCQLIKNSVDNTIRAQANNVFTLFPGRVQTYVYLYSSETDTDDYTQMKLEASNYISDLDQGHSIYARVSLYGQRYWRGRTSFLMDNKTEWKTVETETVYISA